MRINLQKRQTKQVIRPMGMLKNQPETIKIELSKVDLMVDKGINNLQADENGLYIQGRDYTGAVKKIAWT